MEEHLMRQNISSSLFCKLRPTLTIACVLAGLLIHLLPAESRGQFRDITPVKEPAIQPESGGTEAPVPQPIQEPIPEPEPVVEEVVEELEPAPEPPPKPLTIEELEELLSDEIETQPEEDFALRSLKFRGLTVGESTLDELLNAWGRPFKIVRGPDSRIIKYRATPFRQVDVTVVNDTVAAILIHLNDVLDPAHCARELRISNLEPVPVPDEFGKVMGLAFPERGVLFGFDSRDPEALVSKIQLEPVNPEPFLLRAEYDFERKYEMNIADVDQALELSPKYARAHWLRSVKLADIGRFQDALESADKAVHFDPENGRFRLHKARVLAKIGNHDTAVRTVERIVESSELPTVLRAEASALLGNLLASGQEGKYKEALEHHLEAIELAAPIANEREFAPRRLAKDILIRTHLAVARDISLGDFQSQDIVVPQWLGRARALVEESVKRDQGDRAYRLDVYHQTLATAADVRSGDNPSALIAEMQDEGKRLIADAKDNRTKSRLEWKLGSGLAEAVRMERIRGNEEYALKLADKALDHLQQSARTRQSTPEQRYLVGRLYFHIGSLHAVHNQDHPEAIAWYRKAQPLLSGEVPPGVLADPGTHGEMFVSMGVSYWEEGDRARSIALTEQGTDILQQAVVDGILKPESLKIPYGNLAAMHKKAGNSADASAFAELAAAIDAETMNR